MGKPSARKPMTATGAGRGTAPPLRRREGEAAPPPSPRAGDDGTVARRRGLAGRGALARWTRRGLAGTRGAGVPLRSLAPRPRRPGEGAAAVLVPGMQPDALAARWRGEVATVAAVAPRRRGEDACPIVFVFVSVQTERNSFITFSIFFPKQQW